MIILAEKMGLMVIYIRFRLNEKVTLVTGDMHFCLPSDTQRPIKMWIMYFFQIFSCVYMQIHMFFSVSWLKCILLVTLFLNL